MSRYPWQTRREYLWLRIRDLWLRIRYNPKCFACGKRLWFVHVERGPQFCGPTCEDTYYEVDDLWRHGEH